MAVSTDLALVTGLMVATLAWFAHGGFVQGAPSANLRWTPRGQLHRLARRGEGPINLFALWAELWGLALIGSLLVNDLAGFSADVAERVRDAVWNGGVVVGMPILVWIFVRQRGRMM